MEKTKQQINQLRKGQIFHENYTYWFIVLKIKEGIVDYLEGPSPHKLIHRVVTVEELKRKFVQPWDKTKYKVQYEGIRPDINKLIKIYLS